jgi:hypothetical protein
MLGRVYTPLDCAIADTACRWAYDRDDHGLGSGFLPSVTIPFMAVGA